MASVNNDSASFGGGSVGTTETIDYSAAGKCATRLIELSGQMNTILKKIEGYLQEIGPGSATYSGSSASVVQGRFNEFSSTFESFVKAVNDEGEFVNKAVEAYGNVDSVI